MQIKDAGTIAKKYVSRGSAAGQDYATGVANPRNPWAASTVAAKGAYASGVQTALSSGSFEKGVNNAGDAKWSRKAAGVGAQRYGPGVTAAQTDYQNGVAPYLAVLQALQLPPRGAKGDPSNISRVTAVNNALRQKKVAG